MFDVRPSFRSILSPLQKNRQTKMEKMAQSQGFQISSEQAASLQKSVSQLQQAASSLSGEQQQSIQQGVESIQQTLQEAQSQSQSSS